MLICGHIEYSEKNKSKEEQVKYLTLATLITYIYFNFLWFIEICGPKYMRGDKTNRKGPKFQSTNTAVRTTVCTKVLHHLNRSMAALPHFAREINLLDTFISVLCFSDNLPHKIPLV
jgi:hypothetical protein